MNNIPAQALTAFEQFMQALSPKTKFEREEKKLLNMLDDMADVLEQCEAILAGGAITSLFTNNEINDFDIYFRDKESLNKFLALLFSQDYSYRTLVSVTERSILMTDHADGKLQAIIYRFFESPETIFKSFDFTVNMGAYDFKTGNFVFHEEFFKHNAQRYLSINEGTDYPLVSMLRVDKYRQKGYSVSKPQLLKLMFRISQIEFNNWDDVLSHVGGMYGIDPEKIFDKTKDFSMDEAISQIGKLETIDNTWNPGIVDTTDIAKQLENVLTEDMKEAMMAGSWYQGSMCKKILGISDKYDDKIVEQFI